MSTSVKFSDLASITTHTITSGPYNTPPTDELGVYSRNLRAGNNIQRAELSVLCGNEARSLTALVNQESGIQWVVVKDDREDRNNKNCVVGLSLVPEPKKA